jgi:hypothetical protein
MCYYTAAQYKLGYIEAKIELLVCMAKLHVKLDSAIRIQHSSPIISSLNTSIVCKNDTNASIKE